MNPISDNYCDTRYFIFILIIVFATFLMAEGQTNPAHKEYIEKYKNIAIKEMKRVGVPASITLAQGILESSCGKSQLALKSNNHFGIKCGVDWKGKKYYKDDDAKKECFRKYKSIKESYKDHSDHLKNSRRYAFLFDLKITDYKGWAYGLKKAGYATNPNYAELLIKIIEENKLYELDKRRRK